MFDWGTFKKHPKTGTKRYGRFIFVNMLIFFVLISNIFLRSNYCAEKHWKTNLNRNAMSTICPITQCHQPQVCWTKTSRFVSTVDLIYMTWIHVGSNPATIEYYIVKWGLLSICPVRNLSGTVHPRALQDLQVSLCWKARCWKASETELKNSFQPKGCVIVLKSTGAEKHPRRTGRQAGSFTWHPSASLFFVNGWRQGQSLQVNLPCKQWNLGKSHPVWVGCRVPFSLQPVSIGPFGWGRP